MTSNFRSCYKLQYIEEANNMCTQRMMMLQLFPPKFASHQLNCKHHFMIILKGSVNGSTCSFKADAFFSMELCILLLVIFGFCFYLDLCLQMLPSWVQYQHCSSSIRINNFMLDYYIINIAAAVEMCGRKAHPFLTRNMCARRAT